MSNEKLKYTDMCIYIDNHIYTEDYDPDKVFYYLWRLFYALSKKKKFFYSNTDYEDYSYYCACHLYFRLVDDRQFLEENNPKKLSKIKSVLNYIKRIMYPLKVNYCKDKYKDSYPYKMQLITSSKQVECCYIETNKIRTNVNDLLQSETLIYFNNIANTIKQFLKNTPYYKDKKTYLNLYISCLLTLLRGVTLSNEQLKNYCKSTRLNRDSWLENAYYEASLQAPVVWHLPQEMTEYIGVLVEEIKTLIINDINYLIKVYTPKEDILQDILLTGLIVDKEEENNE